MNMLQTKIEQARLYLVDKGLYDVRVLALFGVGFIALSVFWSGAKIVQQNFELSQKVAEIEQENQVLILENKNRELENEYLATDEFAELTARRVFGKASPGERVYIVPEDVALGALSEPEVELEEQAVDKPQYQENIETWLSIYFGG
jgi:cell division protein FtsB